ncbi:ROK family protein [Pseudalkalibacillus decolorationis]|uniref:ROK family protein n=1 Tax=Pseudalkalibacillus decolorationis TaxID=163879 RepID=UPI0021490FCE|nr:ROK family protein [Pseudalkalibacillus decolorationis]
MKAIGIDIGGTTVKGSLIDDYRNIHKQVSIPTAISEGREGILSSLTRTIDQVLEGEVGISGIGIGTAGRVNVKSGEVVYSTDNLPGWQGINLRDFITNTYSLPVVVDNDANAALVGELWSMGKPYKSITMLTLGTGVGGANKIDGEIVRGHNWNGGEWGHVILYPNGRDCNCGKKGCIEQYLSGKALLRIANEQSNHSIFENGDEIFEAFVKGDKEIKPVVDVYLNDLVLVLYNLSIGLDSEAVIIGGGVIDSQDKWWHLLKQKLAVQEVHIDVLPASLGNKAGMIGAVKLLFDVLQKGEEKV